MRQQAAARIAWTVVYLAGIGAPASSAERLTVGSTAP